MQKSDDIEIVAYGEQYQEIFRDLNVEWISSYFKMEAADYKVLDDPNGYIIKNGGFIFVALYQNEPLGVCALIKKNADDEYELAKMAVSPKAQGKNLGTLLGQAVIEKAKMLGASSIYLESNTALKPAINLYRKLGFVETDGCGSVYERCNIQMELRLVK